MEIAIIIFFLTIFVGLAILGITIFIAWKLLKSKKQKSFVQKNNFSQSTHDSHYSGNYIDND